MRHLRCMSWAVAGAILGLAVVAYGQATATSPTEIPSTTAGMTDPTVALVSQLLAGGGLPTVLALAAWWLRGAVGAGIPIVVQLHPDDRAELRRVRRAIEHDEDSDDSTPDGPPERR